MSAMASQITGVSIVCTTVCSGADQRKHQSSGSLAFVRGIHRRPLNSPHKGPVTRKMFPFNDVIMWSNVADTLTHFGLSMLVSQESTRTAWVMQSKTNFQQQKSKSSSSSSSQLPSSSPSVIIIVTTTTNIVTLPAFGDKFITCICIVNLIFSIHA